MLEEPDLRDPLGSQAALDLPVHLVQSAHQELPDNQDQRVLQEMLDSRASRVHQDQLVLQASLVLQDPADHLGTQEVLDRLVSPELMEARDNLDHREHQGHPVR